MTGPGVTRGPSGQYYFHPCRIHDAIIDEARQAGHELPPDFAAVVVGRLLREAYAQEGGALPNERIRPHLKPEAA